MASTANTYHAGCYKNIFSISQPLLLLLSTMHRFCLHIPFIAVLFIACKFSHKKAMFTALPPSQTGIYFTNAITETAYLNSRQYDYIYNGGGVAVADFNNDGLQDVYFTGNMVSSRMYLNKGGFKFQDVTEAANAGTSRWALGVSVVDINQDGWMDFYVCNAGVPADKKLRANQLFINQGKSTDGIPVFKEMADEYGLADTGYSCQAAFFDYDRDGDLDMYLLTNAIHYNENRNLPVPKKINGENDNTDHLYQNQGVIKNGHPYFNDVSSQAGILIEGYGLGLAISDINRDGWPDIYCSNDFVSNDLLWINNHDGTFTNRINEYVKHQSFNGMGVDIADINNDGLQDIMVVDMLPETNERKKMMLWKYNYDYFKLSLTNGYQPQYIRNTLQLNNGSSNALQSSFSEIGQLAGVQQTDWSWAPLMTDLDNDSYRDIVVSNGYRRDITNLDYIMYLNDMASSGYNNATPEERRHQQLEKLYELPEIKLHNYIYHNNGNLSFTDMATEWGFEKQTYSNGAAYADLDNDGDMDLLFNNMDDEAGVYRNELYNADDIKQDNRNWINFKLKGKQGNLQSIGATVNIFYDKYLQQTQENFPVRGYQSSVSDVLHFGLGKTKTVDSAIIRWPDGKEQKFLHIRLNKVNEIVYGNENELRDYKQPINSNLLFETVDSLQTGIAYQHQQHEMVDFNNSVLLPHLLSKNGPGIAIGDADGNGLDDFFVGGDIGQERKIFFQKSPGKFESKKLAGGTGFNDMGSLFFDADADGDNDLYIVSGGSTAEGEDTVYQDRLYLNDGKGNFSFSYQSLPAIKSSGSCVAAADMDGDGDLDLFRGGMVNAGNYPSAPASFVLRNDTKKGGSATFIDATPAVLKHIGTVSTALWTDFNNDGNMDLMLAGEWMPITLFANQNGKLSLYKKLLNSNGWWNSLTACDMDMDGDMDYIAGNYGLNSKYKAGIKEPVELYLSDFDKNGSTEPVITQYSHGVKYVVPFRDLLADQMPSIKKRFADYHSYATVDFENTFIKEEIEEAQKFTAYTLASSYINNNGNGSFEIKPLPVEAQFSSVYGVQTGDYNNDGNMDILLTGNCYAIEPQTGWNDASVGLVLAGNGKGEFKPLFAARTGLHANMDAKAMSEIHVGGNKMLLLLSNNNGPLQQMQQTNPTYTIIRALPADCYAIITMKDGKKQRCEFGYGNAYLSQSSRTLKVPPGAALVEITDYRGHKRNAPV